MKLSGIYVPHITPFKKDQSIDYEALKTCIDYWIKSGLSGLVTLGSNGEFPYILHEERTKLIKTVIDHVNGRTQVIVGTGAPSTIETIQLSRKAVDLGADALIIVPPYYFKISSPDLIEHYKEILDKIDAPVILYDVPKFTGYSVEVSVFESLVNEYSQIVGIKDSTNNLLHISELIRRVGDKIAILGGTSRVILPTIVLGGRGAVVAVANFMPEQIVKLYKAFKNGNLEEARKIQLKVNQITDFMKAYNQIAIVKAITNIIGLPAGIPRRPIQPIKGEELEKVRKYIEEIGLIS